MSGRPNEVVALLDFETRSACSIRLAGSWRYSLDETTEVLCAAFRLPHWPKGKTGLWHPAFDHLGIEEGDDWDELGEFFQWVEDGRLVESHNSWFEAGVWQNICVPRYGWPVLKREQRRCSAAKAASHSLPRALDKVADALNLEVRKDDEGSKVMKKLAKPRNPVKAERDAWGRQHSPCNVCNATGKVDGINPETGRKKKIPCGKCQGRGWLGAFDALPEMPILYHESRELFERLWAYCRVDILAEEGVSEYLPDLSPDETEMFLLDAAINERGFELDTEAVSVALDLIDSECVELNAELATLTDGKVAKATQRAKMIGWFNERGLAIEDTQADTIDGLLESRDIRTDIHPDVWRGLELVKTLGKSSTAKFEKMQDWVCPDRRVHGGLLYHGASTGRWTGQGIQPHNFPRGTVADQELLWTVLKSGDPEFIRECLATVVVDKNDQPLCSSIMDALSSALRGAIVPAEGHQLYVADFAGIEARVLLWLADDEDGLDIFRQHRDIYNEMASEIFGRPINRKLASDKNEGALGKVAILGLGYQMGANKFIDTALALGGLTIDLPTSQRVVDAYRAKFWRVKQLWYDTEKAAIRAVQRPDRRIDCGRVTYIYDIDKDFLYCELPSGRRLAYPSPRVRNKMMPWGQEKPSLSYMGISQFTRQWSRQDSYGGLLVENNTQAVARDLMAASALRCERSRIYVPVLTVHDEMLAEAKKGVGSVKEFEALMAATDPWAEGLPVAAEGWVGTRYRK